jgi:hypothetical protein
MTSAATGHLGSYRRWWAAWSTIMGPRLGASLRGLGRHVPMRARLALLSLSFSPKPLVIDDHVCNLIGLAPYRLDGALVPVFGPAFDIGPTSLLQSCPWSYPNVGHA